MSENTFSSSTPWSGAAPLQQENLIISDFQQNGGVASFPDIYSITNTDGGELQGGELTVRLNLDPNPASGLETFEIKPATSTSIYDGGGSPMADTTTTGVITLNGSPVTIVTAILADDNSYITITFNDTVYTNEAATAPLISDDFNLIFNQNTGNATNVTISSLTDNAGEALTSGVDTLRIYLNVINSPASGAEYFSIQPENNSSIYNTYSVPMLTDATTGDVFLYDKLAPSITETNLQENNNVSFTTSERLYKTNLSDEVDEENFLFDLDNSPLGSNADDITINSVTTPDAASTAYLYTLNLNISPLPSGVETVYFYSNQILRIFDSSGNELVDSTALVTLNDKLPPILVPDNSTLDESNSYVILTFNEGLYTDANGNNPVEATDFNADIITADNTTTASITSVLNSMGSALSGGETSIRLNILYDNPASGAETMEIQPEDDQVFDSAGNAVIDSTSAKSFTLNPYPWLDEYSLDDDNGYVDLIFSEGVYSASDCSSAVDAGDFNLSFSQNNGNATGASIVTLSKIDSLPLSGGETTIRAVISVNNSPASGAETIQITPTNTYSVCNYLGNRLAITDCTVNLTLNDRLPPTITAADIASDTIISLSVSEGIYNILSGGVASTDFHLEFYSNNGNASTAQIINVSNTSQGALNGGETTILIGFATDSLPSGSEEIEFHPASNTAIYDSAYNPMLQTTISERVTLPDQLPPRIIAPSADISSDNSYVIFTLTEGVYGVSELTAPVEPNDFTVEFIQNGGNATGAEVNYITNYRQFPLIGGEDILRCYLTIQGTPSGHERLYIRATDDLSVFDLNNNGMDTSQGTDTLQLYDQLVPTVDSVSIPHGSPIGSAVESPINITFSEPIQSFGYSVSARHYSYLTYSTDTTATSFKVTLQPPMASLDTITLSIFNLTDNSGLEAVDFSYEFYTPPLGDYEPYDGKVNVLDLAQFVSFWMADSQPAILGLGPTSGTFPHLVPLLDEEYNLDDGMTFIRMWSWSLDRFGLEPLTSPTIGIAMNWDKLVVDIPMEAIAGQVYLRYNPLQGKVDLNHTAFGNNNLTLKREAVENGEILLEFGLVEPDDNARVISIKPEINEPAEATVIYKFFAADQSLIAAGTQKIALVIPTEFRLIQNYPNPFNNTTTIRYAVPEETFVQLEIFNIKGRLVETLTSQSHQPGFYALQWSGQRAASGVYFIKLEADKTVLTQKMILLK